MRDTITVLTTRVTNANIKQPTIILASLVVEGVRMTPGEKCHYPTQLGIGGRFMFHSTKLQKTMKTDSFSEASE